MEEVDFQTKRSLVVEYIFYSIFIISIIFIMGSLASVFDISEIENPSILLGCTLGFISFIFISAMILMSHLEAILKVIDKLRYGEYK